MEIVDIAKYAREALEGELWEINADIHMYNRASRDPDPTPYETLEGLVKGMTELEFWVLRSVPGTLYGSMDNLFHR